MIICIILETRKSSYQIDLPINQSAHFLWQTSGTSPYPSTCPWDGATKHKRIPSGKGIVGLLMSSSCSSGSLAKIHPITTLRKARCSGETILYYIGL
ncbi:hypothetical protein GDO86_012017 [Hymenochirus boettgeri]|uniref:Uncharacterized protein n=1 Tax=Hymenochirus boettgeri TaxID=247094 RepID=A0A8T2JIR5_9PIPI|nr:hypothetical protein GDO86_012017 [Hymenochirus boettgeri]